MTETLKLMNLTKEHLKTLTPCIESRKNVVCWFKKFCDHLSDFLLEVKKDFTNINEQITERRKEAIYLYILQLNSLLMVLINIFTKEDEQSLILLESRNWAVKQLQLCLAGLEEVLFKLLENSEDDLGFVKLMDTALDKVIEVDVGKDQVDAINIFEILKPIVEEVLCHGMSIAQIALENDSKCIRGCSKEVISSLNSLESNIKQNNPNIAMCNLFVDDCCDKLCFLERKVNTAVLKLCLQIFSKFTHSLQKLYGYCSNSGNNEEHFEELVADFDLNVDRIIQIGLFAISCSGKTSSTIKMKNCLASLEALESEIVPAFTNMHYHNSDKNIQVSIILKEYWLKQAITLKKYIYLIIDPYAFCQITHEIVTDINVQLEESSGRDFIRFKSSVNLLVEQVKVLLEMLDVATNNKNMCQQILNINHEISEASKVLLKDNETVETDYSRVYRRCKIMEYLLQKLLKEVTNFEIQEELKEPSMILKTNEQENELKNKTVLDHIESRGKEILKERSILYKTPVKIVNFKLKSANKIALPLSKLVHLRNLQFSQSRLEQSSINLQITDILENLTSLSRSFCE